MEEPRVEVMDGAGFAAGLGDGLEEGREAFRFGLGAGFATGFGALTPPREAIEGAGLEGVGLEAPGRCWGRGAVAWRWLPPWLPPWLPREACWEEPPERFGEGERWLTAGLFTTGRGVEGREAEEREGEEERDGAGTRGALERETVGREGAWREALGRGAAARGAAARGAAARGADWLRLALPPPPRFCCWPWPPRPAKASIGTGPEGTSIRAAATAASRGGCFFMFRKDEW